MRVNIEANGEHARAEGRLRVQRTNGANTTPELVARIGDGEAELRSCDIEELRALREGIEAVIEAHVMAGTLAGGREPPTRERGNGQSASPGPNPSPSPSPSPSPGLGNTNDSRHASDNTQRRPRRRGGRKNKRDGARSEAGR